MNIYLVRHGTTEWNSQGRIQGRTDIRLDSTGVEMARQTGLKLSEEGIIFDRIYSSPLNRAYTTAELIGRPTDSQDPSCPSAPHSLPDQDNNSIKTPDIITDTRLSELGFGCFEGRIANEMFSDPECIFRYFKTDPKRYNDEILHAYRNPVDMTGNPGSSGNSGLPGLSGPEGFPESLTMLLDRTRDFIVNVIEPLILSSVQHDSMTRISSAEHFGSFPDNAGQQAPENILISGHGAVNRALLMYFLGVTDLALFWGTGLQPNCGIVKISCTQSGPSKISYDVQDEYIVLYDKNLVAGLKNLL